MGAKTPLLVFGDDHSPGADLAWHWVTAQRWPGWTVDVVTVTEPPPGIESIFVHDPLHPYVPESPRNAPIECGIIRVRHLTTAHDPRIVLGGQHEASCLVIGARGRGLLKSMRIGSTAEWLMRGPAVPLVIARRDHVVGRVIACVDGSTHAAAAVAALAGMPWIKDCSVDVLAVIGPDESVAAAAHEAVAALTKAGAAATARIVESEPESWLVSPTHHILDSVEAVRPDLVVLGTRGFTGIPRLVLGSVASAVTHAVPCSVLLAQA